MAVGTVRWALLPWLWAIARGLAALWALGAACAQLLWLVRVTARRWYLYELRWAARGSRRRVSTDHTRQRSEDMRQHSSAQQQQVFKKRFTVCDFLCFEDFETNKRLRASNTRFWDEEVSPRIVDFQVWCEQIESIRNLKR